MDFGGQISAIILGAGANVSFSGMSIRGAGPPVLPQPSLSEDSYARKGAMVEGWPSLISLNGSSVSTQNAFDFILCFVPSCIRLQNCHCHL